MKRPLAEGPQHFFHEPPALPSVADRVRMILADIDWSSPVITIWVPGTSEYWIKQRFLDELHAVAPGAHVSMVPYEATWRFSTSVPDGVAVLQAVLDEIARRKPRRPVLLAGESQGAWVISQVLTRPKYAKLATRTSLWGHPAAAPQTFGRAGSVREVNHPGDIVTLDLGDDAREVMAAVEQLSRKHYATALAKLSGYVVQNPKLLVQLLKFWSFAVPMPGRKPTDNAHDYDDDVATGIGFLLEGLRPKVRAAFLAHRPSTT